MRSKILLEDRRTYCILFLVIVSFSMLSASTMTSFKNVNAQSMPSPIDNSNQAYGNNTFGTGNNASANNISHGSPTFSSIQKANSVNVSKIGNKSLTLTTNKPKIVKDIEELKPRTKITEKQTELAKEQTKQLFSKLPQTSRNNILNRQPPSVILFNPKTIPTVGAQSDATNNTSNNATNSISNNATYDPFGTSTRTKASSTIETTKSNLAAISGGWDGLNINNNPTIAWRPPDIQVAAGPNNVVEMSNVILGIYDKSGGIITVADLHPFFLQNNDEFIGDPQVIFDTSSGHWFASVYDGGTTGDCTPNGCSTLVAVSASTDPSGIWYIYQFPWGNTFPDQGIIATSDDKLVISVNDFDSTYSNVADVLVADKNAMIAGGTTSYQTTGYLPGETSIHPAQSLSSTDCIHMVSVGRLGSSIVKLSAWCGNPASGTANFYLNWATVTMYPSAAPLQANQPSGVPMDTGDGRELTAAYQNGKVWHAFNDACVPNGGSAQACIRVQEIDLSHLTGFLVDTYVGSPGVDTFYPALTINNAGKMLFIFGISGQQLNPSLIVGDATWMFAYLIVGSSNVNEGRYGDYFGAGPDPSGQSAWVAGEYGSSSIPNDWSTFIGNIF